MSVKIIYRPVHKDDVKGYLKIRVIENRKTTIKSLGIKISGKNWLESKQRVSKSEPYENKINDKIKDVLRELNKYDTPTQAIQSSTRSILDFYDEIIGTTLNNGTRLKYLGIRNKFEKYLNSIGHNDMKLSQLTTQHVSAFHLYIRVNGCAINTANYNLKSFKAIINKAIKSGLVHYPNDPFGLLTLKYTPTSNKCLTTGEVEKLINGKFIDKRKKRYNSMDVSLEDFRDIFLFQLFSQGLRCSDVQLLRWSDLEYRDGVIIMNYTQYKTKKPMRLKLTLIGLKMLSGKLTKLYPNFKIELNKLELLSKQHRTNLEESIKFSEEIEKEIEVKGVRDAWAKYANKSDKKTTDKSFEDFRHKALSSGLPKSQESFKKEIKEIDDEIYSLYATTIRRRIFNRNSFIFHFLNDKDFIHYKDGANLTPLQYKRLTGTRHYYNIILKEIAKQCDISLNLTSHVARHTYTQLLLDNNADVVAISQSLGHSNLSTTQTYISQLPNNKLLDINESLNTTFNK